jgi:phage tail-like protein
MNKSSDVTLKRGVIGSLDLYSWLNDIRNGNQTAMRNVTVQLMSEDRSQVVLSWTLQRAKIIKYTCGPLNAKGTDVAMEEMVLAYERLVMDDK